MNKRAFITSFLRSPRDVGSIIPSSKFMIKKTVECAAESNPQTIVELGGGTGVITNKLRELDSQVIVFEKDRQLRAMLTEQFADIFIYENAFELEKMMAERDMGHLDTVICGLPLTLFPQEAREQLLQMVYDRLKPNGNLVIYQYSRFLKETLHQKFDDVSSHYIPLNIPPAFVFNCYKRSH